VSDPGAADDPGAVRVTVYEFVGGKPFFDALVGRFYAGVMGDPRLAPLYDPDDVAGARSRLSGFLTQYWGGPDDYSRERGHPRLRMRHFPFAIGPAERDRWMHHMRTAVNAADTADEVKVMLLDYFAHASAAMQNRDH
jgi:hemoglobin